jgi:hypothetical protein
MMIPDIFTFVALHIPLYRTEANQVVDPLRRASHRSQALCIFIKRLDFSHLVAPSSLSWPQRAAFQAPLIESFVVSATEKLLW